MCVCAFVFVFVCKALSARISIAGHLCKFPPSVKVYCGVGYHCVDLFVFSVCRPFLCANISAQFPSSVSPLCAHSKTEAAQRGPNFEKTNTKRAQSCANSQKKNPRTQKEPTQRHPEVELLCASHFYLVPSLCTFFAFGALPVQILHIRCMV